jgi:hypothetical protein
MLNMLQPTIALPQTGESLWTTPVLAGLEARVLWAVGSEGGHYVNALCPLGHTGARATWPAEVEGGPPRFEDVLGPTDILQLILETALRRLERLRRGRGYAQREGGE